MQICIQYIQMMLHFLCVDFQYDGANFQDVRMSFDGQSFRIQHICAVWLLSAGFRVSSNDPIVGSSYRTVYMQKDVHRSEWESAASNVSTAKKFYSIRCIDTVFPDLWLATGWKLFFSLLLFSLFGILSWLFVPKQITIEWLKLLWQSKIYY